MIACGGAFVSLDASGAPKIERGFVRPEDLAPAPAASPDPGAGHRIRFDLDAFDALGREVPVLIDLKPSGQHYMEHFHHAGGMPKLMQQLGDLLDLDAKTVAGGTLREVVAAAEDVPGQTVIRSTSNPIKPVGAMAVLRGNLAPRGAVISTVPRVQSSCSTRGEPSSSIPSPI